MIGWALVGACRWRAAGVGAGRGWLDGWMGVWGIWGWGWGWRRTEGGGGVASWGERLSRISAEITNVKRVVVVVYIQMRILEHYKRVLAHKTVQRCYNEHELCGTFLAILYLPRHRHVNYLHTRGGGGREAKFLK